MFSVGIEFLINFNAFFYAFVTFFRVISPHQWSIALFCRPCIVEVCSFVSFHVLFENQIVFALGIDNAHIIIDTNAEVEARTHLGTHARVKDLLRHGVEAVSKKKHLASNW